MRCIGEREYSGFEVDATGAAVRVELIAISDRRRARCIGESFNVQLVWAALVRELRVGGRAGQRAADEC